MVSRGATANLARTLGLADFGERFGGNGGGQRPDQDAEGEVNPASRSEGGRFATTGHNERDDGKGAQEGRSGKRCPPAAHRRCTASSATLGRAEVATSSTQRQDATHGKQRRRGWFRDSKLVVEHPVVDRGTIEDLEQAGVSAGGRLVVEEFQIAVGDEVVGQDLGWGVGDEVAMELKAGIANHEEASVARREIRRYGLARREQNAVHDGASCGDRDGGVVSSVKGKDGRVTQIRRNEAGRRGDSAKRDGGGEAAAIAAEEIPRARRRWSSR
jgi:hypothetical protein